MTLAILKKTTNLTSLLSSHIIYRSRNFCSKTSASIANRIISATKTFHPAGNSSNIHLSPLFSNEKQSYNGYNIELLDDETWQVKSGLTRLWNASANTGEANSATASAFDEQGEGNAALQNDSELDEIDNMRIRGNLFYKLDKNSKEFEEYNLDFHKKKQSKKSGNLKESKKNENPKAEKPPKIVVNEKIYSLNLDFVDGVKSVEKKKVRTPTFNQLTGPYHEPFCLDIFISKGSVRACVIHRVTSKVVAVAHSISKDLKFDLSSTKNAAACAAVGAILAQRALADDIHDIVYTPRKREKLEGKLQIVLQSIIDNGINVKVKLKQRKHQRARI
ncbi:uncharacterized protein LOC126670467 [Mercurialis annua]|uniref:uncharacterized protein LOC126670467 n=1 Tax=Mercurialis annua TaxID=3986 RepID=UPI0021602B42|nr:uncharacterized protein LOC126670467 [Mercurialis annua]